VRGAFLAERLTAQISATVLERVLRAVALILIARQVGPAAFGQYTASLALVTILSVAFGLGLDVWLVRNGYRHGDQDLLAQHATTCLLLRIGLGLLWLAGMAALAPWLDGGAYPAPIFWLLALAVWFEEVANMVWGAFKAALQNQTLLRFVVLGQAIFVGAILALMGAGVRQVMIYVWLHVVVAGLIAMTAVYWQVRTFGWQWSPATLGPTLRAALPFALSAGLSMIHGRADIALLAFWLGEEAAGVYAPAVSLAVSLTLIPTAIFYVIVPVLSRDYTERPAWARITADRLIWANAGLGVLAGGGLVVAAQPLVTLLYGPAYHATGLLLAILGGVLAARFLSLALAAVLVAVDRQSTRVVVQAVVATLNVGLNFWLIRQWGAPAAAWVFVLTEWVLVIGYAILVRGWRREILINPSMSAA
jgi:O-antigen/teichoic acid export membrane protein